MLRKWLHWANAAPGDRRNAIQGALAIIGVSLAAICMWQNAQTPVVPRNTALLEQGAWPASDAELDFPTSESFKRGPRPLPAPPSISVDQLVIHVDKHGNIDVAGEVIDENLFRSLLQSVKQDSTGDVAVLIQASENCEASILQRIVNVCEECFAQYRLRLEANAPKAGSETARKATRA